MCVRLSMAACAINGCGYGPGRMAEQASLRNLPAKIIVIRAIVTWRHRIALQFGIPGNRQFQESSLRRPVHVSDGMVAGADREAHPFFNYIDLFVFLRELIPAHRV